MPSDAKIPAVGCSFVQFGQKRRFCKLHSAAHLCTALKARGRFDSPHPLQSSKYFSTNNKSRIARPGLLEVRHFWTRKTSSNKSCSSPGRAGGGSRPLGRLKAIRLEPHSAQYVLAHDKPILYESVGLGLFAVNHDQQSERSRKVLGVTAFSSGTAEFECCTSGPRR